jgi:hypothetical protein
MTIARRIVASIAGSLAALLAAVAPAQAASYYLDRSNILDDGVNYLQVTITDGADGAIDFTVTPLQALLDLAGDKFEIRRFTFDIISDFEIGEDNVVGLPDQWKARGTRRMDGFGRFELSVNGTGPNHVTSLAFSIVGIDGDTPETYIELSRDPAREGTALFAARVRGVFDGRPCEDKHENCRARPINNAVIAGGSEVPLPATAWMLLTGLAGAAIRARRRSKAARQA